MQGWMRTNFVCMTIDYLCLYCSMLGIFCSILVTILFRRKRNILQFMLCKCHSSVTMDTWYALVG
ncbi:S-adenosyl-L-methionine-dependent methyltransferases superfamily protein [Prunus dulcis]|uniref:S-adenosyl-L-methionine-dependent methyltransferases superfamily protein n=1 Tax=Prunus dulcis TaxID=3755 RepID=A0A5H2XKF0_PRUDU|nr:S-adenosyl-L-methionine-dependent methyltransferases superfamily protein [Prunus dulcis]